MTSITQYTSSTGAVGRFYDVLCSTGAVGRFYDVQCVLKRTLKEGQ